MDKNVTYIVTGCTGYVGNVITKKLLKEGCSVCGLARSQSKAKRIFGDNMPQLIYGDVTCKGDVERLFVGDKPFVVIHTVARVSIDNHDLNGLYKTTVEGTKIVVEECLKHNVKKLLHVSSTSSLPEGICDEDIKNYNPQPQKLKKGYAQAKAMADQIVLGAVRQNNLDASILFFASVLGPGDYGNSHMTQMIIDYINGKLPASIKGGYNDFDIRDVAEVLPQIIKNSKKGEGYIFANRPCEINEILTNVADYTGRKKLITLPIWLAYVGLPFLALAAKLCGKRPLYTALALKSISQNANFSINRAQQEFGYSPRPLKQTVIDHVDFLAQNGMVKI